MENKHLAHHGILGMRWGVRRYQRKDGSLTPAGKKRYDSEMEKLKQEEKKLKTIQRDRTKLDKYDAKKKEIEELKKSLSRDKNDKTDGVTTLKATTESKKYVKDMSDEELDSLVKRITNENKVRESRPELVPLGERVAKTVWSDMISPAAVDLGKQIVKSIMTKGANKILDHYKIGEEYKLYTNNKKKS